MKKSSQNGFAHLGLLLLLVVVAVIALIGYRVANNNSTPVDTTTATTQTIGQIKTTADLDKAKSTLSNVNLDGDLNPKSLDKDVQSLL